MQTTNDNLLENVARAATFLTCYDTEMTFRYGRLMAKEQRTRNESDFCHAYQVLRAVALGAEAE